MAKEIPTRSNTTGGYKRLPSLNHLWQAAAWPPGDTVRDVGI